MTDNITLFVYGSLRPGLPLWNWLEPTALEVHDNATISGALWMVKNGSYPWLTEGEEAVVGTLVTVPVDERLQQLIAMELGAGYTFEPAEVMVEGQQSLAFVFRYPKVEDDFMRVPGQDWSNWVEKCNLYDPNEWEWRG